MKKLLFILLLGLIGQSLVFAQNTVQVAYFHELKGMEDSSGTTHLFYRLYNLLDEDYDIGSESCIIWRNDVFYFNTQTQTDSLRFKSFRQYQCLMHDWPIRVTQDFTFLDNNLNKWFLISNSHGPYSNNFGYIRGYNDTFFHAGWNWIDNFNLVRTDTISFGVYNFHQSSIVNIIKNDSLPSSHYNYPIAVKASNVNKSDYYCPNGGAGDCFYGKSDSVLIYGHNFLSVDQHQEGGLYFQRNDSLFWSNNLGKTMNFMDDEFPWSLMDSFLYGESNSSIIAVTRFKYSPLEIVTDSANYYQLLESTDNGQNWEEVFGDSNKIYVSQTLDNNGHFYAGNKQTVYEASNYGESFTKLLSFDSPITGLYKKPDSDILYVLTTEELLEVSVETQSTTSLKKIPVSNEQEPSEIPKQISLEQNYPNPFNPNTVISYQLTENSLVRLEVFDVTGRKVAVLVDGKRKTTGTHQITFDASRLSSGVYFYRLEAGGQTLTKKMMLVK